MKKENLKLLYYLGWIVGLIAAALLVYGIIKALI
jgi:cytosine/uracil/thiamine/allantoin permease